MPISFFGKKRAEYQLRTKNSGGIMKNWLLLALISLPLWGAQAREYQIDLDFNRDYNLGSTINLKSAIRNQHNWNFNFDNHTIKSVVVTAAAREGRMNDFRRPTPSIGFEVMNSGRCVNASAYERIERAGYQSKTFLNPNNRDISNGDWLLHVCGADGLALDLVTVTVEQRRVVTPGPRPRPVPHPVPTPAPPVDRHVVDAYASWWGHTSYFNNIYEDANVIVVRNPGHNEAPMEIRSMSVLISGRWGSEYLNLSSFVGTTLYPGQNVVIQMPTDYYGSPIREVINVNINLKSWDRSGETARVILRAPAPQVVQPIIRPLPRPGRRF